MGSPPGKRELVRMRWGLVPSRWSKPLKELRLATFNARAETVAEKPFYCSAFKRIRCLTRPPQFAEPQHAIYVVVTMLVQHVPRDYTGHESMAYLLPRAIIVLIAWGTTCLIMNIWANVDPHVFYIAGAVWAVVGFACFGYLHKLRREDQPHAGASRSPT